MKNQSMDSFGCSPQRKSLVKGERFMRVEGNQSSQKVVSDRELVQFEAANHVVRKKTGLKFNESACASNTPKNVLKA